MLAVRVLALTAESAPRDLSIPTAPSELQTIMIRLTEIIREVLGPQHITSTSDEDAPIDHGLLRGVLQSLQAHNIHIEEDVRVVISTIQAYLHSGIVDDKNPLAS